MRVIGYLESSFWTMRGLEFGTMMRRAYAHADQLDSLLNEAEKPQAMLAKPADRLSGTRYTQIRDGVAVIDVNGVIAKRMNLFEEMCFGGTSTEMLLKDFTTAVESVNVESIVLNIDSPGGEAFGINELSQAIFDARGKKPIKAYVSGLGCSGAYWIASAAEEIVSDKSAFLGSIGVVTAWMDDKEFYKTMGIRREVVTSSNAPFKRLDFDNEEHRSELQRELDSIEKVFHKAVARNRKVSVEQVIKDFNQGGVLIGLDAVKAGMSDRVGSLEDVIKSLKSKKSKTASASASAAAKGEIEMGFMDEFKSFASKHGFRANEESESVADDTETTPKAPAIVEEPAENNEAAKPELASTAALDPSMQIEALQTKIVAGEADAFVESETRAGRLFPAEASGFKSRYLQASLDDRLSPLASGSRVESLKASQTVRKPHGFTEEVISTEANQVLLASGEPGVSDERTKQLLQTTPLGKRSLELVKGGNS